MGRWRTFRRWGLRIGLGGFALTIVLAGLGCYWERAEEAAYREIGATPPDSMIKVGLSR